MAEGEKLQHIAHVKKCLQLIMYSQFNVHTERQIKEWAPMDKDQEIMSNKV